MSSDTSGFTKKHNTDGSVNKKYVDVLDEDKPIANQKFVCVSFVSPENILKQRNMFLFNEFIKNYQLSKSMEKYHQFLNFISFKYSLSSDTLLEDFKEFAKEEIDDLKDSAIELTTRTF